MPNPYGERETQKNFAGWANSLGYSPDFGGYNRDFRDYMKDPSQAGNVDYQEQMARQGPVAGLQNAMPPVTPQGTGAVATAGAPQPPGAPVPTEAVGATPAAVTPPVQPAAAAQPAATPAPVTAPTVKPKRRMVTQSRPVQGLRAANGAGY